MKLNFKMMRIFKRNSGIITIFCVVFLFSPFSRDSLFSQIKQAVITGMYTADFGNPYHDPFVYIYKNSEFRYEVITHNYTTPVKVIFDGEKTRLVPLENNTKIQAEIVIVSPEAIELYDSTKKKYILLRRTDMPSLSFLTRQKNKTMLSRLKMSGPRAGFPSFWEDEHIEIFSIKKNHISFRPPPGRRGPRNIQCIAAFMKPKPAPARHLESPFGGVVLISVDFEVPKENRSCAEDSYQRFRLFYSTATRGFMYIKYPVIGNPVVLGYVSIGYMSIDYWINARFSQEEKNKIMKFIAGDLNGNGYKEQDTP